MVNLRKNSQKMILLILIIIFSINTNFYKNLYKIISHKFDNRITKTYGYCNGESIGYLLSIKKKYQINDNPKILNYIHTPAVNWAIINTKKINQKSNKLILLNYPGPVFIKSLDRIDNNLFVLTDTHFFIDKFNKIKNIEILNNSNDGKKFNWTINIYNYDKFRNMNNIKTLMIKGSFDTRLKINLDMNLNDLDLNQTKLYFEIYKNEVAELENLKINIELKNKYILENFQIIDNTKDCYYLERV